MQLQRLEIFGFKSFADKTEIIFSPGITAIVGPNGCGKSNIVDAMKWVLGEQGAKSLRGRQMQDVIFSGTQTRHPISLAEVSLTIENTKNILPVTYNEVTITRRLYRSGESEYLLNKTTCRLKDIVELFLDTGIGSRAYSLIEQGMIGAILSSEVDERRRLFDEAAGIQKYKVRKKSALQKLTITEDHLIRINDLISEVEKRVNSLKRQVGKARRFLKLKDEIRTAEISLSLQQFLRNQQKMSVLDRQQAELSQQYQQLQTQSDSLEADLEAKQAHLLELTTRLSTIQQQRDQITHQINQLEKQLALDQERQSNLKTQQRRYENDIVELDAKLKSMADRKTRLETETAEVNTQLTTVKQAITNRQAQKKQIDQQAMVSKQKVETLKKQQLRFVHEQARHQNELHHIQKQIKQFDVDLHQLTTNIEDIEHEKVKISVELKNHCQARQQLIQKQDRIREKLTELNQESQAMKSELSQIRKQKNETYTDWKSNHSRFEVLQNLKANYEGYQPGVKSLLTEKHGIDGILGTVGDILNVDPTYEKAWESALGDLLQVVVTETDTDITNAIDYLQRKKRGRVIFISLERAQRFIQKEKFADHISKTENGNRSATKVARTNDESYQHILEVLLGEFIFTPQLQEALQYSERCENGYKYVAMSGEIADSGGTITGGTTNYKQDTGILQRNRQLRDLEQTLAKLEHRLSQLETIEEEQSKILDTLQDEYQHHQKQYQLLETQIANEKSHESKWEFEMSKLTHRQENLIQQYDRLTYQQNESTTRLTATEKELQQFTENFTGIENDLTQAEQEYQDISSKREQLAKTTNTLEMDQVKIESQRTVLEKDMRRLLRARQETETKIGHHRNEIETAEQKVEALTIEIQQIIIDLKEKTAVHAENNQHLKQLQGQVAEAQAEIKAIEKSLNQFRRELNQCQQQQHAIEVEQASRKEKRDNLIDYIWRTYGEELKELEGEIDPQFNKEAIETTITEAKEKLHKLGAVNETAPQEYDEEKNRLDFLIQQRQDLLDARQQLDTTIHKINHKAREMFTETFTEIQDKFQHVFGRLFPGGKAELRLEEDIDPLEADINIFARPYGKRLQEMTLLSGGERAMTAIALLFAIYLVKPSPFCILDEVDAPLDDTNIHRFTTMLKEFAVDTQFIIITHNKETMTVCDRLFGVTMEEVGVSTLISVALT